MIMSTAGLTFPSTSSDVQYGMINAYISFFCCCWHVYTGIGSITTLTALALWRCTLVVYCPAKRSSAFSSNSNGQLDGRQAVLLLCLIWAYALAVTCPPLLGWGRYDREAAHIRSAAPRFSFSHKSLFYKEHDNFMMMQYRLVSNRKTITDWRDTNTIGYISL